MKVNFAVGHAMFSVNKVAMSTCTISIKKYYPGRSRNPTASSWEGERERGRAGREKE